MLTPFPPSPPGQDHLAGRGPAPPLRTPGGGEWMGPGRGRGLRSGPPSSLPVLPAPRLDGQVWTRRAAAAPTWAEQRGPGLRSREQPGRVRTRVSRPL